jgi:glycosyltransferase involved in cell wall biosynthesis
MKLALWANHPSPHQADFYAALREADVDLQVRYLADLPHARQSLGWTRPPELPHGEQILAPGQRPLDSLADWRRRIHIIPGYSRRRLLQLALALSQAAVPWAHWSENSQPSWRSPLVWPLKRAYGALVNRHALGALAIGEAAARDFVRWGIAREKIAHLFYAVAPVPWNAPRDEATLRFLRGRRSFLFVGSLCDIKSPLSLIEAVASLGDAGRQWPLVLVGDGPQAEACQRLVIARQLEDRVFFRGVAAREAVGSILRCSQALLVPSRYDGWGVVLNEAASAGLALVASDRVGAAQHLIEPGFNGFVVRPACARSVAAVMRRYVADPELAELHGSRSRQRFSEFTPARNARRLITALRAWTAGSIVATGDVQAAWADESTLPLRRSA